MTIAERNALHRRMTETAQDVLDRIDTRLVDCVARRLGVPVRLLRHDVDRRTHAQIPVFGVPEPHVAQARALGLTVEALDVDRVDLMDRR